MLFNVNPYTRLMGNTLFPVVTNDYSLVVLERLKIARLVTLRDKLLNIEDKAALTDGIVVDLLSLCLEKYENLNCMDKKKKK
jgi:hypothetical protein